MELEVVLDERTPADAILVVGQIGGKVTVTVAPAVEAGTLALLDEALSMAVADVIDRKTAGDD